MRSSRSQFIALLAAASLIACSGSKPQNSEGGQGTPQQGGAQQGARGGAGGRTGGARGAGGQGGGGRSAPAIPVRAGLVKVEQVTYNISAVGSLEAEDMIQVTAELDGVLTKVDFHEGDRVTTKTVLAQIDPERYKLEADRAEGAYRRSVAAAAQATATLARREALAKEQLVSIEDLNQTKTSADGAAADVTGAKAAWDIATQNLSRAFVKPRHNGVVDKRMVDTGAFVRTGTTLATLVDPSRLRLRFRVSETESLKARTGQSPKFKVAATGDRDFTGTIYHVGEVADPTSRQVEILAWVQNPGVLKPGFFAEVTLPSESKKDALVVPETAVQASDRGFVVYAIQDGKAVVREVELGPRTGGGDVEILSGLSAGETIVFEGSDRIANGVAVTPTDGSGLPGAGRNREGGAGRRREGGAPGGGPAGGRPGGGRPEGQASPSAGGADAKQSQSQGGGADQGGRRTPRDPKKSGGPQ